MVPCKGEGFLIPVVPDADFPAELAAKASNLPAPYSENHLVIPEFLTGGGLNTGLGKYTIYMILFVHIPLTVDGGVWVTDGSGVYIAANGDTLDFEWEAGTVIPGTNDTTYGVSVFTGGTGRFDGAEGSVDWSTWVDEEAGVRIFLQDGLISSVGSRRRN